MHRRTVDFPEPDGPTMTITSPVRTVRFTPATAWISPNHL